MRLRRAAEPRTLRWLWLRGLWPDHNPLRRTSDRVEAVIVASALIVFLVGAPLVALFAGHWAAAAAHRAQRDQQVSWHQVTATLLANASSTVDIGYGAVDTSEVRARWTAPNGTARTGEVPAPAAARKGSTVRIWVDQSGAVTGPPLRPAQADGQAVLATVVAPFVLGTVLICAVSLALQVLDRRRLADWDADWQATGPRWNSHR